MLIVEIDFLPSVCVDHPKDVKLVLSSLIAGGQGGQGLQ